jgi:hypothetical protein
MGTMLGAHSEVLVESPQPVPATDAYFSVDVETDGPIPGPYSLLSFGIVYAGSFDGKTFTRPAAYSVTFYRELRPISDDYDPEALRINGLDRSRLLVDGTAPTEAMTEAASWVRSCAGGSTPVMVAYPLGFDWSWLTWYFVRFAGKSPFNHSLGFDVKTAVAVKAGIPIARAGRSRIPMSMLRSKHIHTHHALDDAVEQAELFGDVFEWEG